MRISDWSSDVCSSDLGDGLAQRCQPRHGEAVGHGAVAAQQFETVAEGGELDRAAGRGMIERIAHLFLRHRTELRGTKAARPVYQPADRHLAHAVVKDRKSTRLNSRH